MFVEKQLINVVIIRKYTFVTSYDEVEVIMILLTIVERICDTLLNGHGIHYISFIVES